MIDFPLDGLLDEPACRQWLETHLHPDGLCCPRCLGPVLDICRKQMHTLRHRVQDTLYETLPTHILEQPAFEANELYQNAGENMRCTRTRGGKGRPPPTRPGVGPTRRANKTGQQEARTRHV